MTEQDARELSAQIAQQFPHVEIQVLQSNDERKAPYNWFVTVERKDGASEACLYIYSRQGWHEAVDARDVLK